MKTIVEEMERKKIIAIVRNIPSSHVVDLARALLAGGIEFMEVTFNQKDESSFSETVNAIKCLSQEMKGIMHIGAGTVLTIQQLELAASAGAEFIISPDVNEEVIKRTKSMGLISIPGAITPTEIMKAHMAGADFVKCFPIAPFGTDYFKAIRSPINHIKLMAVGGIQENNLKSFLECGACGAGIGGNLVNKKDIMEHNYDAITKLAGRLNAIAEEKELES